MTTSWLALPILLNIVLICAYVAPFAVFKAPWEAVQSVFVHPKMSSQYPLAIVTFALVLLFIPFLHYAIPAWHSPSVVGGNASCTPAGVAALLSIPVNVTHRVREIPFPSFCHTDEVELLGYGNATAGMKCCAPAIRGSFMCSGFSLVPSPVFALEIVEDSATRDSYVSCCPRFGPTDGIGMTPPGFASMGLSAIVGVVVSLLLNGLGMAWDALSAKCRRKSSADTPDETEVVVMDRTADDSTATTTNSSGFARFPAYIDVEDERGLCHALSKTNRYLLARCAGTVVHIEQIVKSGETANKEEPLRRLCSIDLTRFGAPRDEERTLDWLPENVPAQAEALPGTNPDEFSTELHHECPNDEQAVSYFPLVQKHDAVVACCFAQEDTLLFLLLVDEDGFVECDVTSRRAKHVRDRDAPPRVARSYETDVTKDEIYASNDGLIVLYSVFSCETTRLFQRATSNDDFAFKRKFDRCVATAMTSTGNAVVCLLRDGNVDLYRNVSNDSWNDGDVGVTIATVTVAHDPYWYRSGVAISDDASVVAVVNWDQSVVVDTVTKAPTVIPGKGGLTAGKGSSVSVTRDGELLVVHYDNTSTIFRVQRVVDENKNQVLTMVRLAQLRGPFFRSVTISPDGQLVFLTTSWAPHRGQSTARSVIWNIDVAAFETLDADNELTYNRFVLNLFQYSTLTVVKGALGTCIGFVLAVRGAKAAAAQGETGWSGFDSFALTVLNSAIVSNLADLCSTGSVAFFRPTSVFRNVVIEEAATSTPCCPDVAQRLSAALAEFFAVMGKAALALLGGGPLVILLITHWIPGVVLFVPTIAPLLFPFVIAMAVLKLVVEFQLEKNYQKHGMPLQLARGISLLCCLAIGVCVNMALTIIVRFPINAMLIVNGLSPYPYLGDTAKQSASSLYTGLYDVMFYLLQMSSNTCASLTGAQSVARSMDYYMNTI